MKKLLLAVSALALSAATASAADLAARPYVKAPVAPLVYDWSGWYVGINGGGGWDREGWNVPLGGPSYAQFTGSGGTAGGQFGWRTQTGWLVWGFDIQGNWADIKGSGQGSYYGPNYVFSTTVQSYETLAATAGYAINNVLLYAKGGAAAVQSKHDITYLPYAPDDASITESRWGGMLGAGLEYGLTPNWTIGIDYIHIFGGGNRVETFNYVNSSSQWGGIAVSQDLDIVTARINYKFGGPVVARY